MLVRRVRTTQWDPQALLEEIEARLVRSRAGVVRVEATL